MQEILPSLALERGADLAGWAALGRGELALYSLLKPSEANRYHSALVIAKRHRSKALENLRSAPTPAYDQDYRRLNQELRTITKFLESQLVRKGIACLAVDPSETLDHHTQRGLISHRALAERAGLGIRGRNNLLITHPNYPGIRLCSLLTELHVQEPAKSVWPYPCKECDNCRKSCPVQAIGDEPEDFRIDRCLAYLEKIHVEGISFQICGVCLAACN